MENQKRFITVKGIGNASQSPDLIIIKMTLETEDFDYEEVMIKASVSIQAIKNAIVSAGHDAKKLKTTNFNVETKYESYKHYESWKQKFSGYKIRHNLSLEFDLNMQILSDTLTAISRCNVKPNFNINFSVKNPSAVSEELLKKAVEDASRKAEILVQATGSTLGKVNRIDYNWNDLYLFSDTKFQVLESPIMNEKITMDLMPDDIEVSDSATIVWEILD